MAVASAVTVVGVGAWQTQNALSTNHSSLLGTHPVTRALEDQPATAPGTALAPGTAALTSCDATVAPDAVQGVISIPKFGIQAPVLQGTDDAELNVGVGHDPNSVWPGSRGNSVLEAHDVSYFQNLPSLLPGDMVIYQTPCTTYTFAVQSQAVVAQGTAVYNTPNATMTLVTCWPTNALFFTPSRYIVSAEEVAAMPAAGSAPTFTTASPAPTVAVPGPLAQQGVTLDTFAMPMGTLAISGSPDSTWAQTTNPMLVENSAVEAFIAGLRSLEDNRLDWWASLAPGVSPPSQLVGAKSQFLSPLEVTVDATGATPNKVLMSDRVRTIGTATYVLSVTAGIAGGALTIAGWSVAPS